MMPDIPAEMAHVLQATRSPSQLADLAASLLDIEPAEKQLLLETHGSEERLEKVLKVLSHRIEVLRLSQKIGARTKEQMDDRQCRFILKERLTAIKKELGENGGNAREIAATSNAISAAKMPRTDCRRALGARCPS